MCWNPFYIVLILLSTIIDYWAGLLMDKTEEKKKRKLCLVLSLAANLGLLFTFKYFNFFSGLFNEIPFGFKTPYLNILLPIGISFYTFQTLSYTIDVYFKKRKAERDFLSFACYVSFFPQLVAGPIERSTHLLPQFHINHQFDFDRMIDGLKLILWGVFKKVVIADRLAVIVDQAYAAPMDASGGLLLLATYFFAFQIYCDFSGYSDIAIGSARVLGYDLMINFNNPYSSKSVAEFWRRWHISLSTWFKDYLYFPLGGNRVKTFRWVINIMIVFVVSGLWHGANLTFIFWGALHGVFLVVSRFTQGMRKRGAKLIGVGEASKIQSFIQILLTFHLVVLTWVFFRAQSLSDAFLVLKKIVLESVFTVGSSFRGSLDQTSIILTILIIIMLFVECFGILNFLKKRIWVVRWAFYHAVFLVICFWGAFHIATNKTFLYFQF